MHETDLSTTEGNRESQALMAAYERIAHNITRIDGTMRDMGESMRKCGVHHRRVARAHRFFSGASNSITGRLQTKGAGQVEAPAAIQTQEQPPRRRLFDFARRGPTATQTNEAAAPREQNNTSEAFDDSYLEELAKNIHGTPENFIRTWNREYRDARISDIAAVFAIQRIDLPANYLSTETTLAEFLGRVNRLYENNPEFKQRMDAGALSHGFSDAHAMTEDFIITTY